MMKKYKVILVRCLVVLLALCIIACLVVWNAFRERKLETIELPSGDRIVISYYPSRRILLGGLVGTGGLRYHIYSGMLSHHGSLTRDSKYDWIGQLRITYQIEGERRVKIKDGRSHPGWIFSGDSAGHYRIIDLYFEAEEEDKSTLVP